ncbi:MAG: UDP-N-acetylmuramate dehydrogenase [Paraglaciecola sp.]|jgi:UDP-N-acetylmuramate dehydrogenase
MKVKHNISLRKHNTFGINTKAKAFVEVFSEQELIEVLKQNTEPIFLLGGGSNLLLRKDVEGLIIKNQIFGKKIIEEDDNSVVIEIGGGENWHEFVLWTLENGWSGLENLSLIPGTVGASPIQNIGAYGVELKDTFEKLQAIDLQSFEICKFNKSDCQFGYRDSIFKRKLKGKICITKVYFRLSKTPEISVSYGAIQEVLNQKNITQPTPKDVSNAVVEIRQSKLPDPAKLGNSGSFFKNPEIEKEQFLKVQKRFPNIVFYPLENGQIKVPAGWLIEQVGWKGKRIGDCGSHTKQALVLVNYGKATGAEIWDLAMQIQASVFEKFGIKITPEVNIW